MRGNSLTPSIESAFNDPILWGGNPNHRADTLGCDHPYHGVHFGICDVSVFGVNDHELPGNKSGRVNEQGHAYVETHLRDHPGEGCSRQHQPGTYDSGDRGDRENHLLSHRARLILLRHTNDRFLCISPVPEELMESKVTGRHSEVDSDEGPARN